MIINNISKQNILLEFLLMIFFYSCINLDEGKSGTCETITESKNKGVFITERFLEKSNNYHSLGNNITVINFWIENMWDKGKTSDDIIINKNLYQFIITLDKGLPLNSKDSIYVICNNDSLIELGIFNHLIYANYLTKNELTDSIKLDFYLRNNLNKIKLKTLIFK